MDPLPNPDLVFNVRYGPGRTIYYLSPLTAAGEDWLITFLPDLERVGRGVRVAEADLTTIADAIRRKGLEIRTL